MNIIIVGAGRLGCYIASSLTDEGHNVTVIDRDEELVKKIVENLDVQGVHGSGAMREILDMANVEETDMLIATTNSDENNILTCFIARNMGAKHTIARVRNPEYSRQMNFMQNKLGISMLLNPALSTAREISRIIQFPSATDVEMFANGIVDIAQITISEESKLANIKVSNLPARLKNYIVICAVSRKDEVFIPNGDFVIQPGDNVYITSSHKHLGSLVRDISASKISKSLKDIMIIGGSTIAFYLAQMLENENKNIIIIEKNPKKCDELSERLKDSTVICGNASDYDFLSEEGIDKMDAVVTLTDSDEVNILISLFSSKLNVQKTITKTKNPTLSKLLNEFSNNTIINDAEVSGDLVTQYIRAKSNIGSGEMKTLYKLLDGKVEAAEFLVDDRTRHTGEPLNDIKFKSNIIIGSICRNGRFIVPNGNVTIENEDRVVVFSKDRKIKSINEIFA